MAQRQLTDCVLMIPPSGIAFNTQTAVDNAFQHPFFGDLAGCRRHAVGEFDALVGALRSAGVRVVTVDPPLGVDAPDAVFPNNWFSTHADGTVVLYPLAAENRRSERRVVVIERLRSEFGFHVDDIVDLSHWELQQVYLEGTGSLVLDRVNEIAYASLSPRTSQDGVDRWCRRFGYQGFVFQATSPVAGRRRPIYHTNVMLSLGESWAIVCLEAIEDRRQRAALRSSLVDSGKTVVEIDLRQMSQFGANIMQIRTSPGDSAASNPQLGSQLKLIAISTVGLQSLRGSVGMPSTGR